MKRIIPILWSITLIVTLAFGIYVGSKVTSAYKDVEIMDLEAKFEAVQQETSFWQGTLTRLAEGDQLPGIEDDLNGREGEGPGKEER